MKAKNLRLIDEFTNTIKEPKVKSIKSTKPFIIEKSNKMSKGGKVKKSQMRHGQY